MTTPHLDDEQLSSVLDDGGADHHVSGCDACGSRLAALGAARDALAAAPLPTLPPGLLDGMVARALAAEDAGARAGGSRPGDGIVAGDGGGDAPAPIPLASRRRLRTPPPSWLVGAVAAIAVLAGVAGLVQRAGDESSPLSSETAAVGRLERGSTAANDAGAGGSVTADEVVLPDLGEVDDPGALVAILAAAPGAGGDDFQAPEPAAAPKRADGSAEPSEAQAARGSAGGTTGGQAEADAAPSVAAAPPGVQCRDAAERIGAGRFGAHLSTSLVRWRGQPAEVLVFLLTEPANGVNRQALVLARPGCALLADPRF